MTFEFIYEKYFDEIHRYCYYRTDGEKYCTDEATAETFFLLQKQWETVKDFHEDRLRAWLYGVAKNKIKEVRREQDPTIESLSEERCRALIDEQILHEQPLNEEEEDRRFVQYIDQICSQLKPKDLNLFQMRVVEEMSHREIGEKLGISENAAKLRWARLVDKLKPIVDKILENK